MENIAKLAMKNFPIDQAKNLLQTSGEGAPSSTNLSTSSSTNSSEILNQIIKSEELRKELFSAFCKALISIINTYEGFFKDVFEKKLNEISETVIKETITKAINQTINAEFLKSVLPSEEIVKYFSEEIKPHLINGVSSNKDETISTTIIPKSGGRMKKKKFTRKYRK
jgi:hypothetical protein